MYGVKVISKNSASIIIDVFLCQGQVLFNSSRPVIGNISHCFLHKISDSKKNVLGAFY